MEKKSQTHVEIILSFAIFVGFIFAIFVFLNPLKTLQADYSSLEDIQNMLLDNVSITYKSASLILDEGISKECIIVNDTLGATGTLLVKGKDGIKPSKKENNKIYLKKDLDERYFMLYFSNAFNFYTSEFGVGCVVLDKANYTFGALNIERTAMLDKLAMLNTTYMNDYDAVKKNLRIARDFDFYVLDENRNTIMNDTLIKHKVTARTTVVREIPLNVIDSNANIRPVIFGLRAW